MPRLFLLRHAKSSLQADGQGDFDRPLNARGRAAAPTIGAFIRDNACSPDLILCSTARRARETLALILPCLQGEATILLEDALYLASSDQLLTRLNRVDDTFSDVMIIAHNPGLQDLSLALASFGTALPSIRQKFPTGALAQIEFDAGGWASIDPKNGVLSRFITPRSLADGGQD